MVSRTVVIAPSSARARAPAQSKFPSDTTVDKGTQGRTAVPTTEKSHGHAASVVLSRKPYSHAGIVLQPPPGATTRRTGVLSSPCIP